MSQYKRECKRCSTPSQSRSGFVPCFYPLGFVCLDMAVVECASSFLPVTSTMVDLINNCDTSTMNESIQVSKLPVRLSLSFIYSFA